jgi:gas vesicle protein
MTSRNTALAFALGAAVGGITALLLAPDKGEVTRQRIRETGARVAHKGAAAVDQAKTTVEGASHVISDSAKRQAGAVGEAFAAAKETYVRESHRV